MVAQVSKTKKQTEIQSAVVFRCTHKVSGEVFYAVPSDSGNGMYKVTYNAKKRCYECNCPATCECKHIRAVREVITIRYQNKQQVPTPAATPDEVAAQAEVQAEAKMQAFKAGMEAQYASDPRVETQREEQETRDSYMRAFYAEY